MNGKVLRWLEGGKSDWGRVELIGDGFGLFGEAGPEWGGRVMIGCERDASDWGKERRDDWGSAGLGRGRRSWEIVEGVGDTVYGWV